MAIVPGPGGLTGVIRPEVFPDIRPKVSITAFPQQEPEKDESAGRFESTGSDGKVIDLNYTFSITYSRRSGREEKREYTIARVFRVREDSGGRATGVDRGTFVDVEMPTKIKLREGQKGPTRLDVYRQPRADDYPNGNVEIRETQLVRQNPRGG